MDRIRKIIITNSNNTVPQIAGNFPWFLIQTLYHYRANPLLQIVDNASKGGALK